MLKFSMAAMTFSGGTRLLVTQGGQASLARGSSLGFSGNVVRTVMSTHSYEPEATPEEAAVVNQSIPNFNNNMSSIAEESPANVIKGVSPTLPFDDKADWLNAPSPCSPPPNS